MRTIIGLAILALFTISITACGCPEGRDCGGKKSCDKGSCDKQEAKACESGCAKPTP